MTRRALDQRTLPGLERPKATRDDTPVTIPMVEVGAGSDIAWHLKPMGVSSAKAAFAPRSLVTRGHPSTQFTMPRWIAADRGWL